MNLKKNGYIDYLIKVFSLQPSFYNLKGGGWGTNKGFVSQKR